MFRFNKAGELTLTPASLAVMFAGVAGFGGWMTKMSYDVGGWESVAAKVSRVENILLYNHLTMPDGAIGTRWPDPSLPYSGFYALPAATARRESEYGTP